MHLRLTGYGQGVYDFRIPMVNGCPPFIQCGLIGNWSSVNSRSLSVLISRYNSSSVMLGRCLEFDNLLSVFCGQLSVMFAEGIWVGWIDRIGCWSEFSVMLVL